MCISLSLSLSLSIYIHIVTCAGDIEPLFWRTHTYKDTSQETLNI